MISGYELCKSILERIYEYTHKYFNICSDYEYTRTIIHSGISNPIILSHVGAAITVTREFIEDGKHVIPYIIASLANALLTEKINCYCSGDDFPTLYVFHIQVSSDYDMFTCQHVMSVRANMAMLLPDRYLDALLKSKLKAMIHRHSQRSYKTELSVREVIQRIQKYNDQNYGTQHI